MERFQASGKDLEALKQMSAEEVEELIYPPENIMRKDISVMPDYQAVYEHLSKPGSKANLFYLWLKYKKECPVGYQYTQYCHYFKKFIEKNYGSEAVSIRIFGKGAKERLIHIGNEMVIATLKAYAEEYQLEIRQCGHFFANQSGNPLSDQSARRIIRQYTESASVSMHITPHMFRHTFASSLLDQDVDIRYIQEMLGHSSIRTTEIYTHVSLSKQKRILRNKHPRNTFSI